jgi:protein tyrosine phosphatase (PTP) superfamily phosphohydrolase (DUF442 family)
MSFEFPLVRRTADARWSVGGLLALCALLVSQVAAVGAERPIDDRFQIEHPAQPLADSLRSIAKQTGISILFDPGVVTNRMSHAVSGRMTGAEAIARALARTGLTSSVMKDGSIVVRMPAPVRLARSDHAADDGGTVLLQGRRLQEPRRTGRPHAQLRSGHRHERRCMPAGSGASRTHGRFSAS